jgi:hypothetical protein
MIGINGTIYKRVLLFFWLVTVMYSGRIYAGEYAADFLRIGTGARALAMGGAYVALANDVSAPYWNPACLSSLNGCAVQLDHVSLFKGLSQYNALSIALGFDKRMALSLTWIRLGVDDIPHYAPLQGTRMDRLTQTHYRSTGEAKGYFSDTEDAVFFTFARKEFFDLYLGGGMADNPVPAEFSFGISGKYIRQNLDDAVGTGQGLDAGLLLRFISRSSTYRDYDRWLGFGLQMRDLSRTAMVWSTTSKHRDEIQTGIQAGVAASNLFKSVRTRLTLSADKEFGFYNHLRLGGELFFFDVVAVRGGYFDKHFSAGAGMAISHFEVDYAFVSSDLENSHRVTVIVRF